MRKDHNYHILIPQTNGIIQITNTGNKNVEERTSNTIFNEALNLHHKLGLMKE